MDVQTWTYIIVGITFLIYISIAIWSKANSTKEFYIAGKGVSPLAMAWQLLQIGCQQHLLFLWLV